MGGVLKGERGVACLELGVACLVMGVNFFLVLDNEEEVEVEFCELQDVIGDSVKVRGWEGVRNALKTCCSSCVRSSRGTVPFSTRASSYLYPVVIKKRSGKFYCRHTWPIEREVKGENSCKSV